MALSTDTTMQVVPAGYNCNGGGGMWGGDWSSWIILFLIFGMFGWGGFGGFGGGQNGYDTRAEIQRGFDNSAVVTKLDGITQGICDAAYTLNNTATTGFANAELGAANRQAALMQQMFTMQAANQQCCCDTREAIQGVNYNLAQQSCDTRNVIQNATRDIIDSQNNGTRAILDALTAQRIEAKDETIARQNQQIFQLQLAASQSAQNAYITANQDAQTAELIRRLGVGCPQPAFLVNAPTPVSFPVNACGQVSFANNGCGGCNPCGC